ncbi:MAG: electron transfer flavoprotein subunit alpha/FixB family protein [Anaerolineaceae bacterium]|jgi:electron transfer flavoprotein alpha subunit|nr:electron transfer flavoprotein subunit alpha/FixB family protein [Anaerolineaceae bacterium]
MADEIWTFSEQKNNQLREVSFELLTWGRKLADQRDTPLCAVVLADDIPETELNKLIQYGADKVYLVQNPIFAHFLVEPQVHTMQHLVEIYHPEIILAAATTTGRTVMPYLSILTHSGLTADCTDLQIEPETGNLLQIRPAIGGNIMATIKTPDTRPQMATVRPKSINLPDADPSRTGEIITVTVPAKALASRMKFEKYASEGTNTASLEEANIVVSSGLGLQPEKFPLVEDLANALGAVMGSSRPPVDHGWQPYVRQVGLSGRTISPELYVACGISGAVQHLAGIQTAKNIIAINSDPEAPIFQVADFGIVGDVDDVLPVLKKYVDEM